MMQQELIKPYKKVAVIGSGSWGTALAVKIATNADEVVLCSNCSDTVQSINENNQNSQLCEALKLPDNIVATEGCVNIDNSELIVIATPAQTLRDVISNINITKSQPLVICSKGIENNSLKMMSEVANEYVDSEIAILSGPNFAYEVAVGKVAATTIACKDKQIGKKIQNTFADKNFRAYLSSDVIGVQIAGALKNVIAIAAGIVEGLDMGENARIALITRGISEIYQIIVKKGGNAESIMGLAGIGDIMLTCNSKTSRNMLFGYNLGQGQNIKEILSKGITVEGYKTTSSAYFLMQELDLNLPLIAAIYNVLYNDVDIRGTIDQLLNRPLKAEF